MSAVDKRLVSEAVDSPALLVVVDGAAYEAAAEFYAVERLLTPPSPAVLGILAAVAGLACAAGTGPVRLLYVDPPRGPGRWAPSDGRLLASGYVRAGGAAGLSGWMERAASCRWCRGCRPPILGATRRRWCISGRPRRSSPLPPDWRDATRPWWTPRRLNGISEASNCSGS